MNTQKLKFEDQLVLQQQHLARTVITSSALRNQGGPGMVKTARDFMAQVKLSAFTGKDGYSFAGELDEQTNNLAKKLSANLCTYILRDRRTCWGAARKALNIFLFACAGNRTFSLEYGTHQLLPHLELPLDSYAIKFLRKNTESLLDHQILSAWKSISLLEKELSGAIQTIAQRVAEQIGCLRCELDYIAWNLREDDEKLLKAV